MGLVSIKLGWFYGVYDAPFKLNDSNCTNCTNCTNCNAATHGDILKNQVILKYIYLMLLSLRFRPYSVLANTIVDIQTNQCVFTVDYIGLDYKNLSKPGCAVFGY